MLAHMRYVLALVWCVCLPAWAGVAEFWGPSDAGAPLDGATHVAWIKWLVTVVCLYLSCEVFVRPIFSREACLRAGVCLSVVALAWAFPLLVAALVMLGVPILLVVMAVWPD